MLFIVLSMCMFLGGCSKSLDERVTQKQDKIEIGTQTNLTELFECEDGVNIGIKNAGSFSVDKVGSYSVDFTITDGNEQVDKSFIFIVKDEKAPEITIKDKVVLYEKDKFDPQKYASVVDNSKEDIKLEIAENNVDVNKAGEYQVKYQAKDSSGNKSEKDMKVTVKKVYSFSERKGIVKKLLKDKKYKNLKMSTDNNKKLVWINLKGSVFRSVEKGNYYYIIDPYLVFDRVGKKLRTSLYVNIWEQDKEDYVSPKSLYIRSNKGTISTSSCTVNLDFELDYVYSNFSNINYYFTKSSDLDKLYSTILNGTNLKFTAYTDKYTFHYKCKKKEIEGMQTLLGFYNDLKSYS